MTPRARKRFGQHFLEAAWADKVIEAIDPRPGDRFLEIGPGPGVLTRKLASRAAHVTAIEVDRDLAADLRRGAPAHVEIVTGDFLDTDLSPYLAGGPLRVAGNLPYNISSPILFRLFRFAGSVGSAGSRDPAYVAPAGSQDPAYIRDATVMLQREVADRLAARPGTKDYGVLTIFTHVHADVRRVLTLPPGAFRPAPKVHSAVVRLTFKPSPIPPDLGPVFDGMVRSMFTQRRKTLLNALRPFAVSLGTDAAGALAAAGIDAGARPETLDQAALLRLAQSLKPKA